MTTAAPHPAAEQAAATTARILASLAMSDRGVVVDSPPGAGKSTLVMTAALALADGGERVMLVAQTNEQVDDLIAGLADRRAGLRIGRLAASEYRPAARVLRPDVTIARSAADLVGCPVIASTAHKWATLAGDHRWPWAILDEAYQMRSDLLLRVAGWFDKALFVGDPGQLDPFSAVSTERWKGLTWDPMQSAFAVMLRHNPGIPVYTLPVSWRLPASAAPIISEAFYPFTGFGAATSFGERTMCLSVSPLRKNALDHTVETAAAAGWALYELPARHTLRTDGEAIQACAGLAFRLIQRGTLISERDNASVPLQPARIAVGAAHRDQAQAIRQALASAGASEVVADTANRLQGREFDVTIMLHPLSGRRDATAFHLESGRLCVLASRHRHACIVVARAGIPELLDAHPSTEPVHLNEPVKFPDGWAANQTFLARLASWKVPAI